MEELERVQLAEWADRRVNELSGGMQQRVGLARAFAPRAPILLMDEPFSALDPLIRNKLQDDLLDFQRALGRTILFVSHDLDEALKIGSRIAIMEGGRIVQCGRPQDIVLSPATPYVAEFVAHMNPLNVLRAGEVMTDLPPLMPVQAMEVGTGTPLREIIGILVDGPGDIIVTEAGRPVGWIDARTALASLLRIQDRARAAAE